MRCFSPGLLQKSRHHGWLATPSLFSVTTDASQRHPSLFAVTTALLNQLINWISTQRHHHGPGHGKSGSTKGPQDFEALVGDAAGERTFGVLGAAGGLLGSISPAGHLAVGPAALACGAVTTAVATWLPPPLGSFGLTHEQSRRCATRYHGSRLGWGHVVRLQEPLCLSSAYSGQPRGHGSR